MKGAGAIRHGRLEHFAIEALRCNPANPFPTLLIVSVDLDQLAQERTRNREAAEGRVQRKSVARFLAIQGFGRLILRCAMDGPSQPRPKGRDHGYDDVS